MADGKQAVLAITPDDTVRRIVSVNHKAPLLLKSIGLNPDLYSDKTLRQVCAEKKWNEVELLQWLEQNSSSEIEYSVFGNGKESVHRDLDTISSICEYLSEYSGKLLRDQVERVREVFGRVAKIHGIQYLWLKETSWDVTRLLDKCMDYQHFERIRFIPLATEFDHYNERLLDGNIQKLKRSIEVLIDDQEQLKVRMDIIEQKSAGFTFGESECSAFRMLCTEFTSYFDRLHQHFDLVQNRLIPEIEKKLNT